MLERSSPLSLLMERRNRVALDLFISRIVKTLGERIYISFHSFEKDFLYLQCSPAFHNKLHNSVIQKPP